MYLQMPRRGGSGRVAICRLAVVALLGALAGCSIHHAASLVMTGGSRQLRERSDDVPPNSPGRPGLLILAIDGVDRNLLYTMLRAGELPELAGLLGGNDGNFPHAYFDQRILSTLPSSTIAAWVTAMTGVPPSVHGVAGNEFFIRDERRFAAPAPVSVDSATPVLEIYTDDYVNNLVPEPTVYERMRERDPDVLIWVAMHQIYRGADRLVFARRTVLADAFEAYAEKEAKELAANEQSWSVFEKLDKQVLEEVTGALDNGPVPDVLTVYVTGTDLFAHVCAQGPDQARRAYLRLVLDPLLADLHTVLTERGALDDRFVVVTADHGHTEVVHDDVHALGADPNGGPVAVVREAGFRLRPFSLDADNDGDYQAVLAYGGAMAYVYVADRSSCPAPGDVCDWQRPPRFKEDVLALADAFYRENRGGADVPALSGTLDMVLVRRGRAAGEPAQPFEVYVGNHRVQRVADYLRGHPHPSYVDLDQRLRELAAGPRGDRAGDILLIAHDGDRYDTSQRYYFAAPYHSWHGSPSKRDSEIPLIVAHPQRSTAELGELVGSALGPQPRQQRITDVLLALRFGAANPASAAGRVAAKR
jgi:Type I phosphodiesterase / nucleotide pyrophosphatase